MPMNYHDSRSRSAQRAKRRRTNIILNTLIAIVIALILIVGSSIFLGETKTEKEQANAEQSNQNRLNDDKQNNEPVSGNKDDSDKEDESDQQDDSDQSDELDENNDDDNVDENSDSGTSEIIEKETTEKNVEKIIINPAWEPVGTEQVNGHQPSSEMGSIDWNEKLKAGAYAIGTTVDNMTAWWVGRGENPETQSVLTVQAKDSDDIYRVYIEWVDGKGWKPTKMKKLYENDIEY